MKTPKHEEKEAEKTAQFDDVLRRMLSTPPPKQEPKKEQKKTGK